jgi:hypothetical protein
LLDMLVHQETMERSADQNVIQKQILCCRNLICSINFVFSSRAKHLWPIKIQLLKHL